MDPDPAGARWPVRWRRFAGLAWFGYWVFLALMLHLPKPPRPPIQFTRKGVVVHFTAFAILALAGCVARRAGGRSVTWRFVVGWTLVYAAFGATSEWLQPLTGRHADVWALGADVLGAGLVLVCAWRWWLAPPSADASPDGPGDRVG